MKQSGDEPLQCNSNTEHQAENTNDNNKIKYITLHIDY